MAIYNHCLLPFLCALLRRDCLLYNAHVDNEKKNAIMSLLLPSLLQAKHTNTLQSFAHNTPMLVLDSRFSLPHSHTGHIIPEIVSEVIS